MIGRTSIFFLATIYTLGCQQHSKPITDCNELFLQPEVTKLRVENMYKEAIWQIYKFTIIESNKYRVVNPLYVDSTYSETSLSEFNLKYHSIEQVEDTTRFVIHFERGVTPVGTDAYGGVAFWDDKNKFEIGARFIFIMERSLYEPEFKQYLSKNKEKLSPMLRCLAVERGILEDTK